ncbi:MAG: hypothetical protein ABDH19_00560 [Thermodesulfovibrio sp.]
MNIKKFHNKIGKKVLLVAILYVIFIILLSVSVYLNKIENSLERDLKLLNNVEVKINQTIKLSKTIESIEIPKDVRILSKNDSLKNLKNTSEIFAAQYVDALKARFPEIALEISNLKREQKQLSFDISMKAETLWSRFIEILSFLEQTEYPFVFIKSITLSSKGNSVGVDIKAELKLFYQ